MKGMLQLFYTNYKCTIRQSTGCFWNFQYEASDNEITHIHEVTCEHKLMQCPEKEPMKNWRQQVPRHSVLLQQAASRQQRGLITHKVLKHEYSPAQLVQSSEELLLFYISPPCTLLGKMPRATEYSQWPVGRTKLPFIKYNWAIVQLCFHSINFKILT